MSTYETACCLVMVLTALTFTATATQKVIVTHMIVTKAVTVEGQALPTCCDQCHIMRTSGHGHKCLAPCSGKQHIQAGPSRCEQHHPFGQHPRCCLATARLNSHTEGQQYTHHVLRPRRQKQCGVDCKQHRQLCEHLC